MKKKRRGSKFIALLTTLILLMTMVPIVSFAGPSDITGHWAENIIREWLDKGLASGYPDNTFKPNASITRAEFMALVNKAFYFTQSKTVNYKDVSKSDWYYETVGRAVAAGYISGYPDNTIEPNRSITRQEAAVIIAKARGLTLNTQTATPFSDASSIANWSRGYVGAVVEAGYMKGYPDGTFRPGDIIRRSEAVVALNNTLSAAYVLYDEAGTYGPEAGMETVDNNVIVKSDNVILRNLHITGNLIVSEEVGLGDVTLDNLTVDGETYIRGGGTNSIHINGGKYKSVTVQKTSSGRVRVVATNIDGLKVIISSNAAGQGVVLEGSFESVQVDASGVSIATQGETAIKEMTVSAAATNANVALGENTVVKQMKVSAEIGITGKGTIEKAEVNAENVTFETKPKEVVDATTDTPATTPSGGGSSGGGSDNDTTVNVTGISVSPATMALTVGGSTGTITATVTPDNATNKSVTWLSSNTSVATVSNGVVTPVAVGTTNVSAKSVSNTTLSAICVVTVTAAPTSVATTPSAITLAVGSTNPVGGVTNVAIPAAGGTDTTGAVTGWATGTADKIKFTVTDSGSASSAITINSASYTSGADYTIASASNLTIVVTTTESGKTTAIRTFTVSVTAAPPAASATTPSAITLAVGSTNPVGGVTNVAIPAAGGTDTTGAVTGWVTGTADKIKFTVTDGGSASSAITINSASYTSGADYTIASTSNLTIVVTTTESGKTTAIRTFTVSVTAAPPAANATSPSAITLAVGSSNPVGNVTNVAIPAAGGTDTTGAITNWSYMNGDRIKFTVVDGGSASSAITINSVTYTSGADYTIKPAETSLSVVVTTSETGKTTVMRNFTIPVSENPVKATSPSSITLAVGSSNPVGGVTNVVIPAAGGTDTTGAVTGWAVTTASAIKITIVDAGSAGSLIQINGSNYTSGMDYNIPSESPLSVVVVTLETNKATVVRYFTISVSQ